jgi:hypothetical protein
MHHRRTTEYEDEYEYDDEDEDFRCPYRTRPRPQLFSDCALSNQGRLSLRGCKKQRPGGYKAGKLKSVKSRAVAHFLASRLSSVPASQPFQKPATSSQLPAARSQQPVTRSQQPVASSQQPAARIAGGQHTRALNLKTTPRLDNQLIIYHKVFMMDTDIQNRHPFYCYF